MSSCLTGGARAYRLNLDLIKPPTTFSTSNSSSPSSTLSESSNSPVSIFSRKPRTPRKRPNQTYNEAATILSTAYPKLFPPKNLSKPSKLTKSLDYRTPFLSEPPDLLVPFDRVIGSSGRMLQCKPTLQSSASPTETKVEKPCQSPGEVSSQGNISELCDEPQGDFDAESILDEDIDEGIDSIMGKLRMDGETSHDWNGYSSVQRERPESYCYGFPVGMGFDFIRGMRREFRAMRNVDDGDWWSSPVVNLADIARMLVEKQKKNSESGKKRLFPASHKQKKQGEDSVPQPTARLLLKLNYDDVLKAWSEKGSPFSDDSPLADSAGSDVQARLSEIELFPKGAAPARGAMVLRYKEKRLTRLFSKKIRYQVRKLNADQRPRIRGRFVRTPSSD